MTPEDIINLAKIHTDNTKPYLDEIERGCVLKIVIDALKEFNDAVREKVDKLEDIAYDVPLCADHAAAWFTARYFEPGDCWICKMKNKEG